MSWEQELADELQNARNGEKEKIILRHQEVTGMSARQLYRVAQQHGYSSGRQKRKDNGKHVVTDAQLDYVSALMAVSARKNKGVIASVETALEAAVDNGIIAAGTITPKRLSELLTRYKKSKKYLDAPTPHISMRSEHPNHVHLVDVSVCIQWFLDKGGMGERDESGLYKNKIENFKKIKQQLLRYVLVDHCTGVTYLRYYYGSGETAEFLFDFLQHAWAYKNDKLPFRGVPFALMMDAGSANISKPMTALLERLGVHNLRGVVKNPRRQGGVERQHRTMEEQFEWKLRISPAKNLEQLNEWAEDFATFFNAKRLHSRHKMTRTEAWMKITSEQLRELPATDILQSLFAKPEESRSVSGSLTINFKGETYSVSHIPGIIPREKVMVIVRPYDFPAVAIRYNDIEYLSQPLKKDGYGFVETAATIGKEFKSHKETPVQEHKKVIDELAHAGGGAPFAGTKVFGHQADKVRETYIRRQGTAIQINPEDVLEKHVPMLEALRRIRNEVGALTVEQNKAIRESYGESISIEDLNELIRRLEGGASEDFGVERDASGSMFA